MTVAFEIRIRLIIENENPGLLDFVQVEHALGLGSPDSTRRIGDRFGHRSQRTRKNDGIAYDFFRGCACNPIEEASRLLQRLEAAGDAARSILRQHSAELSIVSRIYCQGEDEPMDHLGFHVTRAFIETLHDFQLELDVDQYVFARESKSTSPVAPGL
jgi:hypothetical protein